MGAKSSIEITKKSRKQKPLINEQAKITEIKCDPDGTEYRCSCCGKYYTKQKENFYQSASPLFLGNNGYVTICKACLEKYYLYLVQFYSGNETKALERIAQLLDWYYSDAIAAQSASCGTTRLAGYVRRLNLSKVYATGKTFSDTIKEEANAGIHSADDIIEANDDGDEVDEDTVNFFGFGYKPSEYRFMREQYEDWTTRHECNTKAQEELFKNLCIAQLNIQQAQHRGDRVTDAMKVFQDLLGSANLKPTQTNDNALADQNTFGTLIRKWEDSDPIPEPAPEWKDVDGIVRYISVYFLGHLCKMLGIKNRYSRMYEAEMEKYKVEKPEYEGDDEALFDAVFAEQIGDRDDTT